MVLFCLNKNLNTSQKLLTKKHTQLELGMESQNNTGEWKPSTIFVGSFRRSSANCRLRRVQRQREAIQTPSSCATQLQTLLPQDLQCRIQCWRLVEGFGFLHEWSWGSRIQQKDALWSPPNNENHSKSMQIYSMDHHGRLQKIQPLLLGDMFVSSVSSSEQTRFISLSLHQVPASKSSSQKNRRVLVPQSHGFAPGFKSASAKITWNWNCGGICLQNYVYLALVHCKGLADIHSMQTDLGKCLSILASGIKNWNECTMAHCIGSYFVVTSLAKHVVQLWRCVR